MIIALQLSPTPTATMTSWAFVAGWLEFKCVEVLKFEADEPLVTSEVAAFIHEVSRGQFKTPHACTFELVRLGLAFLNKVRHRVCCRTRLICILHQLASFNSIDIKCDKFYMHMANVLLHGLQQLKRDHEKDAVLLQTSVKKARMPWGINISVLNSVAQEVRRYSQKQ